MIEIHLDRNCLGWQRNRAFPVACEIVLCVKNSREERNRDENGRPRHSAYDSKPITLAPHAGLTSRLKSNIGFLALSGYFKIPPVERQTYSLTFSRALIITLYACLMQLR
jgi:hypothetical protein